MYSKLQDAHEPLVDKAQRCGVRLNECDGSVICLHVSADGKTAWTGDDGNKLIVWDVDKGTRTHTLSCDGAVICLRVADGKTVWPGDWQQADGFGGVDKGMRTHALVRRRCELPARVGRGRASVDGRSRQQADRLGRGQGTRTHTLSCDGAVICLHVSADGKTAWTGDGYKQLIDKDVEKGTRTHISTDGIVNCLHVSADGKAVWTAIAATARSFGTWTRARARRSRDGASCLHVSADGKTAWTG